MHRSRIPVTASVLSVVVNIGLNIVLVRVMGYAGLALGTSIAAIVNAGLQLFLLRRHLGGIEGRQLAVTLFKVLLAAVAMGGAAWYADVLAQAIFPGPSPLMQGARVAMAIGAALVVLAGAASALGLREFHEARDLVLGRFRRLTR